MLQPPVGSGLAAVVSEHIERVFSQQVLLAAVCGSVMSWEAPVRGLTSILSGHMPAKERVCSGCLIVKKRQVNKSPLAHCGCLIGFATC